ncbi:sulfate transporter-like protein [Xylona heveae TC161]|uniref:Sulfate transporter-like protein n=1 Tax=Xylona heveae (strain CBS 132557 / TC161) TaxID=1328760 RepID=A0A164ZFY7_XYLHT|nr:sulfate transporter-like protein [Xylona heveae TC161]KZF19054.1 sulfate transporter-like protein [Xylona heveae TC161]
MIFTQNIRRLHRYNVSTFRSSPLAEISGSLGDLGTLLPLLIALTISGSIKFPPSLVVGGLANILTGVFFGVPLPVQPMKAIAAVALSRSFSVGETQAAGIFMGIAVGVLSLTGLLKWLASVVPIPVVKGIQVGAGLSLILSAGSSLLQPLGWTSPSWADNLLWALFAFVFLLFASMFPRTPYALLITVLGLVLGIILTAKASPGGTGQIAPLPGFVSAPHAKDWKEGILYAGIGQLPLTVLNSIIAVSYLAAELLPEVPVPSTTHIGWSVALINLIGPWFGAMPLCHGSGGLAAQYRFGARSGASVIFLGVIKVILGLAAGDWLVNLLKRFPHALLGIMVVAAGLELTKVGESLNNTASDLWENAEVNEEDSGEGQKHFREPDQEERRQRWAVMMMTVGGMLTFRNDAVGFIAGMLCHATLNAPIWWRNRKAKRTGALRV